MRVLIKACYLAVIFFISSYYPSVVVGHSMASEVADSFNVTFFDKKVKVVAPLKFLDDQGVILNNSTLGPIYGKIQLGDGKVLNYFHLKSETHKGIDIGKYKDSRIFIIPLNPPGQEIELKLGKTSYEIPAQ